MKKKDLEEIVSIPVGSSTAISFRLLGHYILGIDGINSSIMALDDILDPLLTYILLRYTKNPKELKKYAYFLISLRIIYEILELAGIILLPISGPHPYGSIKDIISITSTAFYLYYIRKRHYK